MKRPQFPETHHYVFEMTIGINSALTVSPGDISTLVIDGPECWPILAHPPSLNLRSP